MVVKREFGPDNELKSLYKIYLAVLLSVCFLSWEIPVFMFAILLGLRGSFLLAVFLFGPVLIATVITLDWIPRFHSSVSFVLDDDKIIVTKGVWWKKKSFVHYNRITNINIYQNPIERSLGLGKVSIQTAGFSSAGGSGGRLAEAQIFGIKNFEEIEDLILKLMKGIKPEAVEAKTEVKPANDVNQQILVELQKIRKILEKT